MVGESRAGGKTRPVVIVSREVPDPPQALVLYVPLNTQFRNGFYDVALPKLKTDSVANVQGLGSPPIVRLEQRIGRLPDEYMRSLRSALAFALDLQGSVS